MNLILHSVIDFKVGRSICEKDTIKLLRERFSKFYTVVFNYVPFSVTITITFQLSNF